MLDWEQIGQMYIIVSSGVASKLEKQIGDFHVTVYSMGEKNPVTRIDIKPGKKA